jgi:hypothetical protein
MRNRTRTRTCARLAGAAAAVVSVTGLAGLSAAGTAQAAAFPNHPTPAVSCAELGGVPSGPYCLAPGYPYPGPYYPPYYPGLGLGLGVGAS